MIRTIVPYLLILMLSILQPYMSVVGANPYFTFFTVSQIVTILLFPLYIGFIRVLLLTKERKDFKVIDFFSAYLSTSLLLKSIALVLLGNVFISLLVYYFTKVVKVSNYNIAIGYILIVIMVIINLYLFLARYLLVLKPELNFFQVIKQSINLTKSRIGSLILLFISLALWYVPTNVRGLVFMSIQRIMSFDYFTKNIYAINLSWHVFDIIYYGCVFVYLEFVYVLFSQKIIDGNNPEDELLHTNIFSFNDNDIKIDDEEEIDLNCYLDETIENKKLKFENNELLDKDSIVFSISTRYLENYDIELAYDTFELYYFLKEYTKIRSLFVKTYKDAMDDNDRIAENSICVNKNNFKLIISINEDLASNIFEIRFELLINN